MRRVFFRRKIAAVANLPANLVSDFALVQNTPFQYLSCNNDNTAEVDMVVAAGQWQRSGESQCSHRSDGSTTPAILHKAIRRWIALKASTIRIAGTIQRPLATGDGSLGRIVWTSPICPTPLAVWQPLLNADGVQTFDVSQAIAAGDKIDFEIGSLGTNETGDGVIWTATLTEV